MSRLAQSLGRLLSRQLEECPHDVRRSHCVACGADIGTESHDQAWFDGYDTAEQEWQSTLDDKELWIARVEEAVEAMIGMLTNEQWGELKKRYPEVYDMLGSFV